MTLEISFWSIQIVHTIYGACSIQHKNPTFNHFCSKSTFSSSNLWCLFDQNLWFIKCIFQKNNPRLFYIDPLAFIEVDNLSLLGYIVTHFGNSIFFENSEILFWTFVKTDYLYLQSVPYSLTPFPSEISMPPTWLGTHVRVTWPSSHVNRKLKLGISEW